MNYFFDTEFYENGETIEPISLGIVSADGRELYLEAANAYEVASKSDWLIKNVRPHLIADRKGGGCCCSRIKLHEHIMWSKQAARTALLEFTATGSLIKTPMFWAYYASYDWVLFAQLFGTMDDLPARFPKHPMDLQQMWVERGCNPEAMPPKPADAHNALADAKWNREFHCNMTIGLPGEY